MNVLIINGHPRKESFSQALVNAYIEGALAGGAVIKKLILADLFFNPNVITISPRDQCFEDDINYSQELILWAEHVVFIYPTWWGTMPAILKGFIDRVFTMGFAFEEIDGGTGYAPLLRGKSAQIITTMDTPLWVYRWIYRSPGENAMRKATLLFCGFKPVKALKFGSVKKSNETQRTRWIHTVKNEGFKLRRGTISPLHKFGIKAGAWLKAIRLQFYPMTWIVYAIGAFGAQNAGYEFNRSIFWLGYLWLFFIEIATVLTNEYFDFKSDQQNKFFSSFTGGSRVIVEKLLSFNEIKTGIFISLIISFIVISFLLLITPGFIVSVLLTCGILFVLALGYTVPPLHFSYRGLGEFDVGITHSFGVVICGYIFQGGRIGDSFPWLLSIPLFFAVLPSIVLSGIPDYEADKAVSKKTLAVRFGKKGAAVFAIIFTLLALIIVVIFKLLNILPATFGNLIYAIIPHAALLTLFIFRYIKNPSPSSRIDTLMIASLTYFIWFGIIPLIKLY